MSAGADAPRAAADWGWAPLLLGIAGAAALWAAPGPLGRAVGLALVWLGLWGANARLANLAVTAEWERPRRFAVAAIFGLTLLTVWEMAVTVFAVPQVILPAPSAIGARFVAALPMILGDLWQTLVKGALSGWLIGAAAAVARSITRPLHALQHSIVTAAGASNAAFYRYFTGKDELILAVMERGVGITAAYLEREMENFLFGDGAEAPSGYVPEAGAGQD